MLELKTIFLYTAVINLSIVVISMVAWFRAPRQKDVGYWLLSASSIVLGGLAASAPDALPFHILNYLSAAAFIAMTAFMRLGFKAFLGQPTRISDAFLITGVMMMVMSVSEAMDDPHIARAVISYACSGVNLAMTACVLWRARSIQPLPSLKSAAVVFALNAVVNFALTPLPVLSPVQFVDGQPTSTWFAYSCVLLTLLSAAGFQMAVILKLEMSNMVQRRLAERDALTGVLNRRMFLLKAEKIAQSGEGVVAIVDLDHFKRINDNYGHKAGDDALVEFVRRTEALLPTGAILGRLGGEEFGLCFPREYANIAAKVLEQMRRAVAGAPVTSGEHRIALTFSCGYRVIDGPDRSLDALIAEADAGLYAAKRGGRNRVVCYDAGMLTRMFAAPAIPATEPEGLLSCA